MDIKQALQNRRFNVVEAATGKDAAAWVLQHIEKGKTVGIGGCMTVQQLGLADLLRSEGHKVYWHWEAAKEEMTAVRSLANAADVYLCSANAVTADGRLVNIDGTGNRLAATIWGPGEVIFLIGKNKIGGTLDEAIERIKTIACPQNARRLKLNTPCAVTGKCSDCSSPQRMCGATLILDRAVGSHPITVVLIDEDLGY